jgi:hypothetical protein
MPRTIAQIIEQANQAAAEAPLEEMKIICSMIADLALHVANVDLHVRRLESKGQ